MPRPSSSNDPGVQRDAPAWTPLPGASSHPGASLRWVWLKVLAVGFALAASAGLIGMALGSRCL